MRKLIVISVLVGFAAILCRVAFSGGEAPARPPRGEARMPGPRSEEMRKLMERMREINQNVGLRELSAQARRDEGVQKAFEAVREAQQKANKLLDEVIIKLAKEKGKEEVINLVKERREILEKVGPLRTGLGRGAMMVPAPERVETPAAGEERPRRPRRRPGGTESTE